MMGALGWKIAKYLVYALLALIMLVVLSFAFTQTPIFKSWLKGIVEEKALEFINGRLEIGKLEGNLHGDFKLKNISLITEPDTVLTIAEIRAGYSIWPLLSKSVLIDSLIIINPVVHMEQNAEGTWNLTQLLKETAQDTTSAPSGEFDYEIHLSRFRIQDGSTFIVTTDSLIPKRIENILLEFTFDYVGEDFGLRLDTFALETRHPSIQLRSLGAEISGNSRLLNITNLDLKTVKNGLSGNGRYYYLRDSLSELGIKAAPLYLSEVGQFVTGLPEKFHPEVTLNINLIGDSLSMDFRLSEGESGIALTGYLNRLFAFLEDSTTALEYSISTELDRIDLSDIMHDSMPASNLNGNIDIDGKGQGLESANVRIRSNLSNSIISGKNIRTLKADIDYDRGRGSGSIALAVESGRAAFNFEVSDLIALDGLHLDGNVESLDISPYLAQKTDKSDLNFHFVADAAKFDPDSLEGKFTLSFGKSSYGEFVLDTMFTELLLSPDEYHFDTLFAQSEGVRLSGRGIFRTTGNSRFDYRLVADDLGFANRFTDSLNVGGRVELTGTAEGTVDSLILTSGLLGEDITYGPYHIDSVRSGDTISLNRDSFLFNGTAAIGGLRLSPEYIANANLEYSGSADSMEISVDAGMGDTISVHSEIGIRIDSLITVKLTDLAANLKENRWYSANDESGIVLDSDYVSIDSLLLLSDGSGPNRQQRIFLDGKYSASDLMDINLSVRNIDLEKTSSFMSSSDKYSGSLDFSMHVSGTMKQPEFEGDLDLRDVEFNDFPVAKVSGIAAYDSLGLNLALSVIQSPGVEFKLNGQFPVELDLAEGKYSLNRDRAFSLNAESDRFPLQIFPAVSDMVDILEGSFSCSLSVSNTINDPKMHGSAYLSGKGFEMPKYGVSLDRFGSGLSFRNDRAVLDSLIFRREGGILSLKGEAEFSGGILDIGLESTQFELTADNFFLTRHKYYQMQISGNVDLRTGQESVQYGGSIRVLKSSLYLPALMAYETTGGEMDKRTLPLLVKAAGRDTIKAQQQTKSENGQADSSIAFIDNFLDRMKGSMKITFPRNAWITSPEMRLELSGELDVVKEGLDFEIFGTIDIVRGHYEMYRKRFDIKEGNLTFQGGVEINPDISLRAAYVFRTAAREKKTLTLDASGKALNPALAFQLDGETISEGDAASYIVFGRSLEDLTYGQRNDLLKSSSQTQDGSLAKGVAADLLSRELSKALGNELALDVIEINARDNWQSASFVVGKYLTNDLFVSYQRDIGEVENDDITPETVTLEYEITRRIFLQLIEGNSKESGFDLFFKFEKE